MIEKNDNKGKTPHQVISPNNLKLNVVVRPEELVFLEELAKSLGLEKSNLIRRAIRAFLKGLGIEVPDGLFEDRSKGNHNPPTEQLKGARWRNHTPKKTAVKTIPPPPGTERLYLQAKPKTETED